MKKKSARNKSKHITGMKYSIAATTAILLFFFILVPLQVIISSGNHRRDTLNKNIDGIDPKVVIEKIRKLPVNVYHTNDGEFFVHIPREKLLSISGITATDSAIDWEEIAKINLVAVKGLIQTTDLLTKQLTRQQTLIDSLKKNMEKLEILNIRLAKVEAGLRAIIVE